MVATNYETSEKHFLRVKELSHFLGVSVPAIWSWTRKKKFPRPIKLSENTTVWKKSDIDEWVESRIAASHQAGGKQ